MLKAPKRRTYKFTALIPLVAVVEIIGVAVLLALAATGEARFELHWIHHQLALATTDRCRPGLACCRHSTSRVMKPPQGFASAC
jgi:hypothetical protein